jgi:hypothetical protein
MTLAGGGKHDLKFGALYEGRNKVRSLNGFSSPPSSAFLAGQTFWPGSLRTTAVTLLSAGAGELKQHRNNFMGVYIQDNFRFSQRLW